MTGAASWEPASDAEVALYEALAAGDQEAYFQTLGRINLLLPVSADAAAGLTPIGWGTWTANNHTHLLAFTSDQSMRTCLAQHVGSARRMSLRDLAAVWPNNDWWLAVNPGLPIEGYLPAWFVAQLARGDARLPGQRSSMPRDRLERVQALERAKAAKAAALPPREPIRAVATAGGPLALPPVSASPRWARGPSSIVEGEEVTAVGPASPPLDVPAVPEPYQSPSIPTALPPLPSRAPAGRFDSEPAAAASPSSPAAPAGESRWAGLAEARWTAPLEEPPQPTEQRRSLFEEVRPTTSGESRSLFEERRPPPPEPGRATLADQDLVKSEERLGLRDRRHTLLSGWAGARRERPEAAADQSSAWRDARPAAQEARPSERDARPTAPDAQRPAGRAERSAAGGERPLRREDLLAGRGERGLMRDEQAAGHLEPLSGPPERQAGREAQLVGHGERAVGHEERPVEREAQPVGRGERAVGRDEGQPGRQKRSAAREDWQAGREEKPASRAEGGRHAEPEPEFVPANAVEQQLYEAAEAGNTDLFLSTLLLATVLIPKASGTTDGKWRPQPIDGEPHIVSYTSSRHLTEPLETVSIKFIKLINEWPDPNWSFAVNPGTPVGATLPGGQLLALANWAAEVGLGGDDDEDTDQPNVKINGAPVAGRVNPEVTVLQKAIAPSQVAFYLERGYDRVTGFVHRAHEVGNLKSASQMRAALGLDWEGSPFSIEADEIYLLRWSAHRPSLYRIPYGGQSESAMHAMQGWVIERAPFRGNGFAPGETGEVIAEFKVDSARLPHGARLLRLKDGAEEMVAVLDADTQKWLRTDGGGA